MKANGTAKYYTSQSVSKITGVTERQLRHWVDTGIIKPAKIEEVGYKKRYLFDFINLIEVRMIVALRQKSIPLQRVRKAIAILEKDFKIDEPLKDLTLFTDGETIFILGNKPELVFDVLRRGQAVFAVAIDELIEDLAKRANIEITEIGEMAKETRKQQVAV